jgi:molybdopterin converting factor small subunit
MAKKKAQTTVVAQPKTIELIQAGNFLEPEITEGITLRQLFAQVEWELADDAEVRVNMQTVKDMDTVVNPGDSVMVIGEINGG